MRQVRARLGTIFTRSLVRYTHQKMVMSSLIDLPFGVFVVGHSSEVHFIVTGKHSCHGTL